MEPWKLTLRRGDCFCVVVKEGLVIYAVAAEDTDGRVIRAWTYSEDCPEGDDDILDLRHLDLPMARWRFGVARELGWPGERRVFGQLAGLARPGEA
jgi:hypothetical protein